GVRAADVHEAAHGKVDATALAVLRHFVEVVASAVPEEAATVPVAHALVVDVAEVAVVASVVDQHGDPAGVVDVAFADGKTLAEGLVAVTEQRGVQVGAAGFVDLVATGVDAQGHAACAGEGLGHAPGGVSIVVSGGEDVGLRAVAFMCVNLLLVALGDVEYRGIPLGVVKHDADAEGGCSLGEDLGFVGVAAAVVVESGNTGHGGTQ